MRGHNSLGLGERLEFSTGSRNTIYPESPPPEDEEEDDDDDEDEDEEEDDEDQGEDRVVDVATGVQLEETRCLGSKVLVSLKFEVVCLDATLPNCTKLAMNPKTMARLCKASWSSLNAAPGLFAPGSPFFSTKRPWTPGPGVVPH